MKHTLSRRLTSLLLAICLVLMLLTFVFAQTGLLTKNRAKRHTLCADLSAQALTYYTGDYSYENLSVLPGIFSPGDSLAPTQGALYAALHDLMESTHTNQNVTYSGYSDTALATYWLSTDSAEGTSSYLYFYTDIDAAEGYTMNREHVWPKSKASYYQRGGGADLHHLRPSIASVNSAKSNHTFGNLYGQGSASRIDGRDIIWTGNNMLEVQDNIKGDVARILLYVYVRWAQPNLYSDVSSDRLPPLDPDDSANSGIRAIESLDTLLEWMTIDPVDDWEMVRNDQVENVQGNRNVFIDYPELAWLMFDLEAPNDYPTPSGEAMNGSHSWDEGVLLQKPTCTQTGMMHFTCTDCGITRDRTVPALGHDASYVSEQHLPTCTEAGCMTYVCARCGEALMQELSALGHSYENGVCTRCGLSVAMYKLTNELHDGDLVILYTPSANAAVSSEIRNDVYRGFESVCPDNGVIYSDSTAIVWSVEESRNGFILTDAEGSVLATGEQNNLPVDGRYNLWNVEAAATEGCIYLFSNGGRYLEWTQNYSDYAAFAYSPAYESGLATQIYSQTVCNHIHTELRSLAPACLADGYENAEFCLDCGARLTLGAVLPAAGHDFGEWQLFDPPDCTQSGTQERECLTCGASETLSVPPLGHNYELTSTKVFCEEAGTATYTCTRCGSSCEEQVDAAGHDLSDWITISAPTCTEAGSRFRFCSRCEYTEAEILPAACASKGFPDVPDPLSWAHKGIDFCIARGIMGSTSTEEMLFSPNDTTTRAMIVSILYRLEGSPEVRFEPVFPDVEDGRWFTSAVLWAYQKGVVRGYDTGLFGPDDKITREQLAVILKAYCENVVGADTSASTELDSFPDAELVTWSKDAVSWAVAEGLISGRVFDTETKLDPQGSATRAEAASVFMRFITKYEETE